RHRPLQKVVGADVVPPLLPRPLVGDQRDQHVGAQAEVVAAVVADVVEGAELSGVEPDAAARAVGREQDLGQRPALDGDLVAMAFDDGHQSERPPYTAMTWPVM